MDLPHSATTQHVSQEVRFKTSAENVGALAPSLLSQERTWSGLCLVFFFLICLPLQRRDYRGASVYGQMWSMNLECCLAHSRHSKNILWNNTEKKIMVRTFQGGPRDVTQSEMSEREKQMPYINVYIWNLEKWYR